MQFKNWFIITLVVIAVISTYLCGYRIGRESRSGDISRLRNDLATAQIEADTNARRARELEEQLRELDPLLQRAERYDIRIQEILATGDELIDGVSDGIDGAIELVDIAIRIVN